MKKKTLKELLLEKPEIMFKDKIEEEKFLRNAKNPVCDEFYILRGYSYEDTVKAKHHQQLTRCKSAKEHYLAKGFNEKEAIKLAYEYGLFKKKQMHANCKLHKNGLLGEQERIKFCRKSSIRCNSEYQRQQSLKQKFGTKEWNQSRWRLIDYWEKRGFSVEDAQNIISTLHRRDVTYFVNKYGFKRGLEIFDKSKLKRRETWKNKSREEIIAHAKKTCPRSGLSKTEILAIERFIKQNNLQKYSLKFGNPREQFWQQIPNHGFRRYDFAAFDDDNNLKIVFEYHGLFHTKEKCKDDEICYFLGNTKTNIKINETYLNDNIKFKHINDNFPDVIYCVAWKEDLTGDLTIAKLRIN